MLKLTKILLIANILEIVFGQIYYNHDSTKSLSNPSWMSTLGDGVPLRQISISGTHISMSNGPGGDAFQTQSLSLADQLASGIRALDFKCRHYYNVFQLHNSLQYLGVSLGDVLPIIQTFLTTYPTETVLMHIEPEWTSSGNSRTYEETFVYYRDTLFPGLFWVPTSQDPTLGEVRGQIVLIQQFGGDVYGLLYSSFTTHESSTYIVSFQQYDKWVSVRTFLTASNTAGSSRLGFFTAFGIVSWPYFVASGKSGPANSKGLFPTLLLDKPFTVYADFPRSGCVTILWVKLCSIDFQGLNILAAQYITSQSLTYTGITFYNFPGYGLISQSISLNSLKFGTCTTTQISQGCTYCSPTPTCLACDQSLFYIYNTVTYQCDAAQGYYLNNNSIPTLCSSAMIGCLTCTSSTVCTLCNVYLNYVLSSSTYKCIAADGYYLDSSTSIPVLCTMTGCKLCSASTYCTEASSSKYYQLDTSTAGAVVCLSGFVQNTTTGICQCPSGYYLFVANSSCVVLPTCPTQQTGCAVCSNTTCLTWNTAQYFVSSSYGTCVSGRYFSYDGVTGACLLCSAAIVACQQCVSATACTLCNTNFTLYDGACSCSPTYYSYNTTVCLQCSIGCLVCTSASICTQCDTSNNFTLQSSICECPVGMFVDTLTESCQLCTSLTGCTDCTSSQCIACDSVLGFNLSNGSCVCGYGYYVQTSPIDLCVQCKIQGCLDCSTSTLCTQCNTTIYYLNTDGTCSQICGDGLLFTLQCDDNNTQDGDGCSSTCTVQQDFTCSGGSSESSSSCSYSGTVTLTLLTYVKDQDQNQVVITALLEPNLPIFDEVDYQQSIVPSFAYSSKTTTYNTDTGLVTFTFNYTKSLNTNTAMKLSFVPPVTLAFYYTASASFSLPETTDNNLSLKVYSEQVYNLLPIMAILSYVLLGLTLLGFLIGFVLGSKLMAVEMLMVVQIAYMGLIGVQKLEILLYPFINLWGTNGYNELTASMLSLVQDRSQSEIPPRVSILGYKTYFLSNFNADVVLLLLPFVVAIFVFVLAKITGKKQWKIRSYKYFKQAGLSIFLALQIHLCVSVCLAFLYGVDQIYGIAIGGALSLGLLVYMVIFVVRPKNFGDYHQFFTSNKVNNNQNNITNKIRPYFYLIVIICRISISATIPILSNTMLGLCCALGTASFLTIFTISLRPYNYNIRPIFNSLVVVLILSVYLAYRVNIIDSTGWISTYTPLLLICLLIVTVLVNFVLICRHIFMECWQQSELVKGQKYELDINETFQQEMKKNVNKMEELMVITPIDTFRNLAMGAQGMVKTKMLKKELALIKTNSISKTLGSYIDA